MVKNETKMTKLTPAQAYALQVKADRRAAALERAAGVIRNDDNRVNAMFAKAEQPKVAKTKKVAKAAKKVRWTSAELDLLIALYLEHVDPANGVENGSTVTDAFLRQFPNRSSGAVVLGLAQIKALDVYHPASGLTDTSQALIDKLYAVDPERFPGGASKEDKISNALDALLAEVRG